MSTSPNRRNFVKVTGAALLGSSVALNSASLDANRACAQDPGASTDGSPISDFRYCLNTSTINHAAVPVNQQIQIAATAGYDSVELWLRDIDQFVKEGGVLKDLRNQIQDLGLAVDSAIAFGAWIVDDSEKRKAGLEQCKRDMETVRALGGTRIAAPPVGATKGPILDLNAAAGRYCQLLEVGRTTGVVPQLELWGFSKNLSTLAEVLFVAARADDPDACILLDIYHMYKGGSDFHNIDLVPGTKMVCLHINDYPAEPNRKEISDKDRVYPGDGVAPMNHILQSLARGGFGGTLSLELFNRTYWKQPPAEVAKTGIEKMKECVRRAFG